MDTPGLKKRIKRETALFVGMLFIGFVLLPFAVFKVGHSVFGDYGGSGYGNFFGTLSDKLQSGDWVAWFLILSPYMVWQFFRLLVLGWRATRRLA